MSRRPLVFALAAVAAGSAPPSALRAEQTRLRQPSVTPVLDNATVTVSRLRLEPDGGEAIHTHPSPLLVILLTGADLERTLGASRARTTERAGSAWFVPANAPHASRNAGVTPVEAIAVAIKPARAPAPAAPATDAPPGITRATILDNADTRVVRVRFAPNGREPVHTHPYDLLTVQISRGRVEILDGTEKTTGARAPGFVKFLPRDVPHAYASADASPFEIVSVTIK